MTPFSAPSNPTRRSRLGVAAVVTIALLMCLPDTGLAAERKAQTERGESFATALHSAGLLARGAGYGSPGGSKAVRVVQRRLSKLGHEPGPIDGLLGPLTEEAIVRLQTAGGLAVDGVVGPETKASLVDSPAERSGRRSKAAAERRPPDTAKRRPSAGPPRSPIPSPSLQSPPLRGPEPSAANEPSEGMAPAYAALLGALGAGLLLSVLWIANARRSRRPSPERRAHSPARATSLNLGVVCAALLGVFAAGAAGGAAFATRAAPDADDSGPPDRGVAAVEPLGREGATAGAPRVEAAPQRPSEPRMERPRIHSPKTAPDRSSSAPAPPVAPAPRTDAPRPAKTYTVRPGDALWPIAEEQLSPGTSTEGVARRVRRIAELNPDRFLSGDPNRLVAGEELRLP